MDWTHGYYSRLSITRKTSDDARICIGNNAFKLLYITAMQSPKILMNMILNY